MATYQVKTEQGLTIAIISNVLGRVALASVSTTSGSNIVTVTSTTAVFAGMPVQIPNIPFAAYIHAVRSATELELFGSAFNPTTGIWTTSAANAQATATASSLLGAATGFDPLCVVAQPLPLGAWRNLTRGQITTTGSVTSNPYVEVPIYTGTSLSGKTIIQSDELSTQPIKRHNGEWWGVYNLISTGGILTRIPASRDYSIYCTSVA